MVFNSRIVLVFMLQWSIFYNSTIVKEIILLTKTTAAQNEVALNYHKVRGLYIQAVVFAATIDTNVNNGAF